MKKKKLPKTDSVRKLAKFWDEHDLTDFADDLDEVREPVFEDVQKSIALQLHADEAQALKRIARSKGLSQPELVRQWVQQKLGIEKGKRRRKAS